jgi:hypothetical protein
MTDAEVLRRMIFLKRQAVRLIFYELRRHLHRLFVLVGSLFILESKSFLKRLVMAAHSHGLLNQTNAQRLYNLLNLAGD